MANPSAPQQMNFGKNATSSRRYREPPGKNQSGKDAVPAYRVVDRWLCWVDFCVFFSQPTAKITDVPILFDLGQHLANIRDVHNQGIAVQHGTHAVDKATGAI